MLEPCVFPLRSICLLTLSSSIAHLGAAHTLDFSLNTISRKPQHFASQLSLYLSIAPEHKLTYPLAGPAGPAAFEGGKAGFEAQNFRGLGVFTSTPVRPALHPASHLSVVRARADLFPRVCAVRGLGW